MNKLTGAATLVGDLNGVTAVSGIEFVDGVPEPGTMGLIGASMAGLGLWRRRSGAGRFGVRHRLASWWQPPDAAGSKRFVAGGEPTSGSFAAMDDIGEASSAAREGCVSGCERQIR